MNDNENIEILKIVIIGESSVGKTTIISQFIDKIFLEELNITYGGSFSSKSVKCEDLNKTINLELWDTAGQERYRSVTKMFYKDADIVLLVYDITCKQSFEELKNYWMEQVIESSLKEAMLVIVANKSDLIEREQVEEEEARKYAKEKNASFFIISAKDHFLVNELFKEIIKKYSGSKKVIFLEDKEDSTFEYRKKRRDSVQITRKKTKKEKKRCC